MLSRDWALSMFVLQFITSTPTLSIARISHVLRPSRVAACPETIYNSAVADMSGCGTVTLNIQLPLSRDRWQKKARKTNDKLHWNVFRFFRQEVKRVIRIAKRKMSLRTIKGQRKHKLCLESYRCLPKKDQPQTTVEDPMVQANRFSDFYVLVVVAAAAKAKALCDHNGR